MSEPTSEQLARQSDHFHAFEWLRGEALKGNPNAEIAVIEWSKFADSCASAKALLKRIRDALQMQAVPLCKCISCQNGKKLIEAIDHWTTTGRLLP